MNKLLYRVYLKATQEGRICSHCGWMITKKNWVKGRRLCSGCWDALQGVNIKYGYSQDQQESVDMTGEMP